jgi:formyltetrahydrofolate dehydrogenase
VKEKTKVELANEDVFMATTFDEFLNAVVAARRSGGDGSGPTVVYDAVNVRANNMDLTFPHQLFVDGAFVDATGGKKLRSVNPNDESLICEVSRAVIEMNGCGHGS